MNTINYVRLFFITFFNLHMLSCVSLNDTKKMSHISHESRIQRQIQEEQEEYKALERLRGEHEIRAHHLWFNTDKEDALELKKPEIFISLGMNCACARNFEKRKLSEAFFPFDWNITQPDSIYRILENDFKDFLKRENLVIEPTEPGIKTQYVFDTLYNIKLIHDFTKKGPALHDYEHIKNKYYRRVARFYKALSLNKPVYFFRAVITKEEAIKLNNLIQQKFPLLTYTLVVAHNTPEFKEPWEIKNIKNFFIKDARSANEIKEWDKVFASLTITRNTNQIA